MTQNPNALAPAHYEPPHPAENPDRVAFMAALDKHEETIYEMVARMHTEGHAGGELVERFRMTRRSVVAAYDHACLTAKPEGT